MQNRRIKTWVGVRYDDASKLKKIVADIKEMIETHAEIDTKQTKIINFDQFGPSSMDILVYCFTRTTNWIRFHEVKQDVYLKIVEIIENNKAEVAFPTTTIHMAEPEIAGLFSGKNDEN